MNRTRRWLLAVPLALVLSACGFTGNLRMDPGFASFRTPSTVPGTDRDFALSLGPVPMRLATMLSRRMIDDEPWIAETLGSIRAVRVYTYEVGRDGGRINEHIETTRAALAEDGWESVVAVREDGGLVSALVMPGDTHEIKGLVVMFQDDEDVTLVNVIGRLEPSTFNTLMAGLEIEAPAMRLSQA